jgi:hypothetical protein
MVALPAKTNVLALLPRHGAMPGRIGGPAFAPVNRRPAHACPLMRYKGLEAGFFRSYLTAAGRRVRVRWEIEGAGS